MDGNFNVRVNALTLRFFENLSFATNADLTDAQRAVFYDAAEACNTLVQKFYSEVLQEAYEDMKRLESPKK